MSVSRIVGSFAALGALLALCPMPSVPAVGRVIPAAIFPHEAAYLNALIIVAGEIDGYDPQRGAAMVVGEVIRGEVAPGRRFYLTGSAGFPFLDAPGTPVTAFAEAVEGDGLRLWQAPTTGGLIFDDPGLLAKLERAHTAPSDALLAEDPRERLSGAYYLATTVHAAGTALSPAARGQVVDAAAWGISASSLTANQAALDTLHALGITLEALGIDYHPGFKAALKARAAARLREWWAEDTR